MRRKYLYPIQTPSENRVTRRTRPHLTLLTRIHGGNFIRYTSTVSTARHYFLCGKPNSIFVPQRRSQAKRRRKWRASAVAFDTRDARWGTNRDLRFCSYFTVLLPSLWNLRTCVSRLKSRLSRILTALGLKSVPESEKERERVKVAAPLSCNHGSGMACLGDISGGRGGV